MKYFLLGFLFIQSSYAALPPLWQDVKELKTILDDPQLASSLQSGEAILKIKRTEKGWLIVTNKNHLPIYILHDPQEKIGPANFTLEFGKASPHE